MQAFIIEIMNQFGYLGIFLFITIENLFPPLPSEIILTFGGFLTTTTELSLLGVIAIATLGSLLGAVLLYGIGLFLSPQRLEIVLTWRFIKILGFKADDVHKSVAWFERYGQKAIFFGRFIPIIRSLISIPAGITKMAWLPFMTFTFFGSLVWNTVLVCLGAFMGESWERVAQYVNGYAQITFIALLAIGLFSIYLLGKRQFKTKNSTDTFNDNEQK